jgi:hypothetical protein
MKWFVLAQNGGKEEERKREHNFLWHKDTVGPGVIFIFLKYIWEG